MAPYPDSDKLYTTVAKMAHVRRPTYTQKPPKCAEIVTISQGGKKIKAAKWIGKNRREIVAPLSADGLRCTVTSEHYYGYYRDHRGESVAVKLHRTRRASERELDEIVTREERIAAGDLSPASSRRAGRVCVELLAEWRGVLSETGSTAHATLYYRRVKRLTDAIGVVHVAGITGPLVTAKLAEWRAAGMSQQTSNHYLTAAKAFTRWLVPAYLDVDPLAIARGLTVSRRTFERRALTPDELDRLVSATASRPSLCGVRSADRAAIYLLVAYTGLRIGEVSRLTRDHVHLDATPPTIVLAPSKGKPQALQVIPEQIVPRLREWLADKPAGWPLVGSRSWLEKPNDVLRRDLAAAGVSHRTTAGVINFHALRTTYATWLARAGVPIQHAQRLLRHSTPATTMSFYVKLGLNDYAGEVAKLPVPG